MAVKEVKIEVTVKKKGNGKTISVTVTPWSCKLTEKDELRWVRPDDWLLAVRDGKGQRWPFPTSTRRLIRRNSDQDSGKVDKGAGGKDPKKGKRYKYDIRLKGEIDGELHEFTIDPDMQIKP